MLKIAVIGAGKHSVLHHGPGCLALKDRLELAAVCDVNKDAAEAYRERFSFKRSYTDYKEMVAKERPDAIVAVTPVSKTKEMVIELLKAGVPILMEKPVGANAQEAKDILEAARKASGKVMVSLNRRFAPMVAGAVGWLKANAGGRPPKLFRAAILRHDRHDPDFITATAVHPLDIMLSVMGMPEEIEVSSSPKSLPGEDATLAKMKFPDGSLGELLIATDCGILSETYEIIGSRYCVRADLFGGLEIHDGGKLALRQSVGKDVPLEESEGALAEMAHFVDAVEGKAQFQPAIQDGLNFAIVAGKIAELKTKKAGA